MNKKISVFLILGVMFSFTTVSAMSVDFFYSDSCSYCQKIKPYVNLFIQEYPSIIWNFKNIGIKENSEELSKISSGVPTFKIKTDDCREIIITGANPKKLNCELAEQSNLDCETYSADTSMGGSWFK